MSNDNRWLKNAIVGYFENRPAEKLDSIDVCSYFKIRVDITLTAIDEMLKEGELIKHSTWGGLHHYLELPPV